MLSIPPLHPASLSPTSRKMMKFAVLGAALAMLAATVHANPNPAPSARALPEITQCFYECPAADQGGRLLRADKPSSTVDDTFICTYTMGEGDAAVADGTCTYQSDTGVIARDDDGGSCFTGAKPVVWGCTPGQTMSWGRRKRNVVRTRKNKPKSGRSSRDMQKASFRRRAMKV
ncbi:hypothetical protein AURDEDRAFT_161207 [Auricularia subglabra TFB-10046 SS5]|nr:hypothetical protein AURDEDRAFT_161207 [Auricularia subglabra TFB-10046 SS5]